MTRSPGPTDRARIVVLGYVVRGPIGGLAWHPIQYALGLHEMGHEVLFVDDSGDEAAPCYDPRAFQWTDDPTFGLSWAASAFAAVGLEDRWAYFDSRTSSWLGPGMAYADKFCRSADIVVNVSGVNLLRDWARAAVTVFVDTDPAFQQARILEDATWRAHVEAHDVHFTFGECIPNQGAALLDDGIAWRATRQPVVLSAWPVVPPPRPRTHPSPR